MAGALSSAACAMRSALRMLSLVSDMVTVGSFKFRLQKYLFPPSGSFMRYLANAVYPKRSACR